MNPTLDLRQLAVRRDRDTALTPARRRRHLVTRFVLPMAVLLAFLGLLGWTARDSLLPAKPVTVVPVVASRSGVTASAAPLFQAAGWVEPRPTPILVTAQAEGVIDRLLVVEDQEVKAGEPVARLIDVDARLAVEAAEADLHLREAEAAGARATLAAAHTNLERPTHLTAALAEAEALLARTETERSNLPFQLRAAEARHLQAVRELESQSAASSAVSVLAVQRARAERDAAAATAEELKAREPRLVKEIEALTRRRDALRQRLELKVDETRALAEAEAAARAAEARLEQARVALKTAKVRLERMTVCAPRAGRVLSLVARPGMRLMGLAPGSLHDSSTVVTLYDPHCLQVRADVRLEDVPRVRPGQSVRIETPAVPGGPLDGEVLFLTSQADIQKNTLQVKVGIKAPPPTLKADVLVQVTFLAPITSTTGEENPPLRLLAPRSLIEAGPDGAATWIADQAAGVARRRAVRLGGTDGDLVEVIEGLTLTDKLIASGRDGLHDGQRIAVTGEEAGPESASGTGRPTRLPRGAERPGKH